MQYLVLSLLLRSAVCCRLDVDVDTHLPRKRPRRETARLWRAAGRSARCNLRQLDTQCFTPTTSLCRPRGRKAGNLCHHSIETLSQLWSFQYSLFTTHSLVRPLHTAQYIPCASVARFTRPIAAFHIPNRPSFISSGFPTIALFDLSRTLNTFFDRQHGLDRVNPRDELFVGLEPTTLLSTPIANTSEPSIDYSSRSLRPFNPVCHIALRTLISLHNT